MAILIDSPLSMSPDPVTIPGGVTFSLVARTSGNDCSVTVTYTIQHPTNVYFANGAKASTLREQLGPQPKQIHHSDQLICKHEEPSGEMLRVQAEVSGSECGSAQTSDVRAIQWADPECTP